MKHILTAIFLWTAFCLNGHAQAKATFDKMTHEFGVVLWKHPATTTFTIKNAYLVVFVSYVETTLYALESGESFSYNRQVNAKSHACCYCS